MKVNVVGAGPAGLYFAIALKQQSPQSDITLFERESKTNQSGLGYVLVDTVLEELLHLDDRATNKLGPQASVMWNRVDIDVKRDDGKGELLGVRFFEAVGIRRSAIVNYLRELADRTGVEIHYDSKLSPSDINDLKARSDLLVGSDGIGSIVRQHYSKEVGAYSIDGSNSFSWLSAKTTKPRMHSILSKSEGIVYVATGYPFDKQYSCIIIECATSDLTKRQGKSDSEELARFNRDLSTVTTQLALVPQQIKWYENRLNGCERTSYENVVLIGESGISTHYTLGAGLHLSFIAARTLAYYAAHRADPAQAAKEYHLQMTAQLKNVQTASLRPMRWLEQADSHYNSLGTRELIDSFRFKATPK